MVQVTQTQTGETRNRVGLPVGLATSIGSLPHFDPGEAVDFVLSNQPRLPAVPSLPARSGYELMLAQAADGVKGITIAEDGSLSVDVDHLDPADPMESLTFGGESWVGLRAFLAVTRGRTGPVKGQITGPVTFGVGLHALGVEPDLAFAVAAAAVRARVTAMLDLFEAHIPQCDLVMFVDEPALTWVTEPGFPLTPEQAMDLVSGTLATIEPRAITGIHCCGPVDWSLLISAGPQILSLPITSNAEAGAAALAGYLERGGWVAWGVVPTDRPLGTTPEMLWRHLSALWCQLVQSGCDAIQLRTQAMITPTCGLAGHGVPQAQQVMEFCTELARRLHDQAIGVRLSVGA